MPEYLGQGTLGCHSPLFGVLRVRFSRFSHIWCFAAALGYNYLYVHKQ